MASKKASFEEILNQLNDITRNLESEEQPLEDAVATYAKGIAAIKLAQARLSDAEQQVKVLMGDEESPGEPDTD
jgi:exodeoxyribonuclease VII small subunit